jgi:ligand-binding sensor domain-containing protein/signal transduction histidine kinase
MMRWVVLFLCSSMIVHATVAAQERFVRPFAQYIHKIYTSDDGLPQNRSRALVQTKDGFLWIGTQDGLARFDGATFEIFNKDNTPALRHNDITSLYETKDSSLWIGTFNGLVQLKNGIFTSLPISTGPVRGLATDLAGNLWIGTMDNGIYKYKDGRIDSITTMQGLVSNSLNLLTVDQEGSLWIGVSGKGLNVYRHGRWSYHHTGNGFPSNSVRSFCVGSDKTIWIGTENGLVKWKDNSFRIYTTADGLSDNVIPSVYEGRSGTLWIGTESGGLCRLKDGVITSFRSTDGLSSDYVTTILEDREESLWVGTFNAGLNQLWKGKFLNYTPREGLPNRTISSVVQSRQGDIWIGTGGSGVLRFNGKQFSALNSYGIPINNSIRSLFEDSRGSIWIGTEDGVARYTSGSFQIYTKRDGLAQTYIRAMGEDHQGHIWIGTSGGLYRLENKRFVNCKNKGLSADVIRSLIVDHRGNVWVGSNEAVMCWQNGVVTTYTQKDGLPSEPIYAMMEDSAHTLWMGSYGGGLVRMKDGKFFQITSRQGLYNDVVYQILEDHRGYLWMSGMSGISCVSKDMLNDFAEGKMKRIQCIGYTTSDGMVSSDCAGNSQSAGCRANNGNLWFPTAEGIVVVNPDSLQGNLPPPPVTIEQVIIDKVSHSRFEDVHVPVGNGQVEFHYSGLSFHVPQKVMFQYKLEGFEKEWRSVGTRRAAFYTNLRPGKYLFRVTACNSDGIWSEEGASFGFELKPFFYQTIWFYGLLLFIIAGTIVVIFRIRVWQLMKKEKELERRVRERSIQLEAANKELEAFSYSVSHDLRAPLRSINGFSIALLEDYSEKIDEQGKDYLQRVRKASQSMEELIDDILKLSRVTRSEMHYTNIDLSAVAQMIVDKARANHPDRLVDVLIEPGLIVHADLTLMQVMLDNLFNNAWKFTSSHPAATIEMNAVYQNGQTVYYIRDDGVGFNMAHAAGKLFGAFQRMHSPAEFEGTGIGLATVQRIIHRHGGRVWAEAAIEKGTTIYFTIPDKGKLQ